MLKRSKLTKASLVAALVAAAAGLGLATVPAAAAVGDHLWSRGYVAYGLSSVDGTGAIATALNTRNPVSVGGPTFTPVAPDGDVFIFRHDTEGAYLWGLQFTPTVGQVTVQEVTTDEDGNIFIAGRLGGGEFTTTGTIDFGGGPLSGEYEWYIAGFTSAGVHRFSLVVGTGFFYDLTAAGGRVAACGYTYDTMDFGGGPLTTAGSNDAVAGVLDKDGNHIWSSLFGDALAQSAPAAALDATGRLVLVVMTASPLDFGGGTITPTGANPCLMRFDAGGGHEWSEGIAVQTTSSAGGVTPVLEVAISPVDGRIAMVGSLYNTGDLGTGPLTSNGAADAFVAVYGATGAPQWSVSYGGTANEYALEVDFDPDGRVFTAGSYYSTNVSFGGGSFSAQGVGGDYFAVLHADTGAHLWSRSFGSPSFDTSVHAATDPQGHLFLWGSSPPGIDFGGGALDPASLFHAELEGSGDPGTSAVAGPPPAARLAQNAPNPFNPSTTIRFTLAQAGRVRLTVHDARGRLVATLLDGAALPAGPHAQVWSGTDTAGRAVASGVYLCRLQCGGETWQRRMTLLK